MTEAELANRVAATHLRRNAELTEDERVQVVRLEMDEVAKHGELQTKDRAADDWDKAYQQGRVHGVRAVMKLLQTLGTPFQGLGPTTSSKLRGKIAIQLTDEEAARIVREERKQYDVYQRSKSQDPELSNVSPEYIMGRLHGIWHVIGLLRSWGVENIVGERPGSGWEVPGDFIHNSSKLTASQAKDLDLTAVQKFIAEQPNPWAICTDSVGRKDKAKYERCIRKVKQQYGLE